MAEQLSMESLHGLISVIYRLELKSLIEPNSWMWAISKLSGKRIGTALYSTTWTWCLRMTSTFTCVRTSPNTWWLAGTAQGTGMAAQTRGLRWPKLCGTRCLDCHRRMRSRRKRSIAFLKCKTEIRKCNVEEKSYNNLDRESHKEKNTGQKIISIANGGRLTLQRPCLGACASSHLRTICPTCLFVPL